VHQTSNLVECITRPESASRRLQERQGRPWAATLLYGGMLLSLLVVTPFFPALLRVNAFAMRIIVTVAGGLVAVSAATVLFIMLSEVWMSSL
jgi:hypothetical protein